MLLLSWRSELAFLKLLISSIHIYINSYIVMVLHIGQAEPKSHLIGKLQPPYRGDGWE
jgi:hypothetical protein